MMRIFLLDDIVIFETSSLSDILPKTKPVHDDILTVSLNDFILSKGISQMYRKIQIFFLLSLLWGGLMEVNVASESSTTFYEYSASVFDYSDYLFRDEVLSEGGSQSKAFRFHRGICLDGKGYGWDTPGTRIRWRTNAKTLTACVVYTSKHNPTRAHNSKGAYFIDGIENPEWTFSPDKHAVRPAGKIMVSLSAPTDNQMHTYELVLPYGDSVDFMGIMVNSEASFEQPAPRPATRCLFYGDSVTHGFTASSILHTYPFLLTQAKGWQLLNMAIGGHSSANAASDVKQFSKLQFDLLIVALGVNDWQGKRLPEDYSKNMEAFLDQVRKLRPDIPVYVISPLWVADAWGKRIHEKYPLDTYRKQLESLVKNRNETDHNLHYIGGTNLIEHDEAFFDPVQVHPNDNGFIQMANHLGEQIPYRKKGK